MKKCECCCGKEVNNKNQRFIHGHQWIINSKFKKQIREKNDGRFIFTKEWNKIHNKNHKGISAWNYKGGKGRDGLECRVARKQLIDEKGVCEISGLSNEEHKCLFKGKGLVVHHIDENINNNDVKNLFILRTDLHSEIRFKKLSSRKKIFEYFEVEIISWEEFEESTLQIYHDIKHMKFKNVHGIVRGGLILGVKLSHLLDIPYMLNKKNVTEHTLICDDIVETGQTIIKNNFQNNFVVSIHYMKNNVFEPNIYVLEKMKRFIIYPWEER